MKNADFATQMTAFFSRYLPAQRNVSPHTIKAYRDVFVLFLRYCRDKRGWSTERLVLADVDANVVLEFLDFLETDRKCSANTRNHRLSALRSFFRYVQSEVPECTLQCQRILAIRPHRIQQPQPRYLTSEELAAFLSQPNPDVRHGWRDAVMLSLMYDCGARVQELIDLRVGDLRLDTPAHVSLTGKGRKRRIVPLMSAMVRSLRDYLERNGLISSDCESRPLFTNRHGTKLSTSGIRYTMNKYMARLRTVRPGLAGRITPHSLRHSKAMHLLEADTPLPVIRDFLGHADIRTTEIYARASLKMKREALEKVQTNSSGASAPPVAWRASKDLLAWLQAL